MFKALSEWRAKRRAEKAQADYAKGYAYVEGGLRDGADPSVIEAIVENGMAFDADRHPFDTGAMDALRGVSCVKR